MDNLGFSVRTLFKNGDEITYRNVTEIHYNYSSIIEMYGTVWIAFESMIHGTGCTFKMEDITEFEAKTETEKAEDF